MSDEQQHTTATPERTSPQGTKFDTETLRDFIRSALRHEAVSDEITLQLQNHVDGKITTDELTKSLRPILADAIRTATDHDWVVIADGVLSEAESILGVSWPMLHEEDRWLTQAMDQLIRESTQSADQLRVRARELRDEAARSNLRGIRQASLVLANRYERAAAER